MKYISFYHIIFSFLLSGVVEDHAAEAKEIEKTDVQPFWREKGHYASDME